ncbi:MAG: AAA family ATPase [Verrucomicrobiae bacterium]|nr:AAA family ATPase [Verrucomicrobiae bacterium]
MFSRWIESEILRKLASPYVQIMFGARQTGKSTLLRKLIPKAAIGLDFSDPRQRGVYLKDPGQLIPQCLGLPKSKSPLFVVIDEAQAVPPIFDAVQHLYDNDKNRWRFVICGSSARKLRTTGANLLPGRALLHHLYPLILPERPLPETGSLAYAAKSVLPLPRCGGAGKSPLFPPTNLVERMTFGELPGLATAAPGRRADLLNAYCLVYLAEELRREALVKDWAAFSRFLQLAAVEAGQILNYAKISKDAGVSQPTVKSYYQLLEDMFIAFRLPAFSRSSRKNLLSTDRFFFFDLGVRHAAAELPLTEATVLANPGPVFEQWVGIELWKRLKYLGSGRLHYFRTKGGAEVDFIIERENKLTPVEVKWCENPDLQDARHLLAFLDEHPRSATHGFIICRCPRPMQLHEKVTALPWFCL